MRKFFLKTMQKISPENSLPLPRNLKKKRNDFTVVTSMIMITPNENLFNFLVKSPSQYPSNSV